MNFILYSNYKNIWYVLRGHQNNPQTQKLYPPLKFLDPPLVLNMSAIAYPPPPSFPRQENEGMKKLYERNNQKENNLKNHAVLQISVVRIVFESGSTYT